MSNSKKTVKQEFSNMYGDGKNLNVGKNKTVNELSNNIKNSDLNTNLNSNENIQNSIHKNTNLERKETLKLPTISQPGASPFKMIYIAIIIIILLIISLLFFYRDMIIDYFNTLFSKPDHATNAANNAATNAANAANNAATTSSKVDTTAAKVEVTSAKVESTSAKIDELDKKVDTLINESKTCSGSSAESKPAVNTLNNKLNNMAPHKKTLTEDAYCYIGYDNGQRECMEAYAGDVCMSGEIFPSLDICINPKLRP